MTNRTDLQISDGGTIIGDHYDKLSFPYASVPRYYWCQTYGILDVEELLQSEDILNGLISLSRFKSHRICVGCYEKTPFVRLYPPYTFIKLDRCLLRNGHSYFNSCWIIWF